MKNWLSPMIAVLTLVAGSARAEEPIPTHVVRDIRRFIEPSEAVVVGTVVGLPEGGRVSLEINQTLFGKVPSKVELVTDGIYVADYEQGSQLLLSLKRIKGKDRYAITGAYEKIFDGNVREYTLEAYLQVVNREFQRLQKERKSLAAEPAEAKPATVATHNAGQ